jgi:hypothetical protein
MRAGAVSWPGPRRGLCGCLYAHLDRGGCQSKAQGPAEQSKVQLCIRCLNRVGAEAAQPGGLGYLTGD